MDELIELVRMAAGREHRVLAEPGSEGEQRARANGYSEPIIAPAPLQEDSVPAKGEADKPPEKASAKTQKAAN